jgi:hypothetical protein
MAEIAVYTRAGRPILGRLPQRIECQIVGALFAPLASRKADLQQLGLFIIAIQRAPRYGKLAEQLLSAAEC